MNPQSQPSTPSYTINCRMTHEAAALERLCQEHLNIALTLEGTRPIAMLQSQLEKLHTVAEVALAAGSVARSRSA